MTFSEKRRQLIKLGLFYAAGLSAVGAFDTPPASTLSTGSSKQVSSSGITSFWREIPDYPDGRSIPGFLLKFHENEFGIRPPTAPHFSLPD